MAQYLGPILRNAYADNAKRANGERTARNSTRQARRVNRFQRVQEHDDRQATFIFNRMIGKDNR